MNATELLVFSVFYRDGLVSAELPHCILRDLFLAKLIEPSMYLFLPWKCIKYNFFSVIYLFGVYFTFNSVQVISRQVVLWAEETSTYSWSSFCCSNIVRSVSSF